MASETFENFMAEMAQHQQKLDRLKREVHTFKEKTTKRLADSQKQRSEDRRSGKMGPDWQVLQGRIDMRKTTESDIFSGVDKSPEARRVRESMVKGVNKLDQAVASGDDSPVVEALRQARSVQSKFDDLYD